MATDTPDFFKNLVIYEIFARAYTKDDGKAFAEIKKDLERLKELGVNAVWFMPIHPTGEKNRKGTLGSPYSIRDYYAIDPALGTAGDFRDLVKRAHELNMLVIMDMVLNHTSTDSVLAREHPDFFIQKDGHPYRKVDAWTDIYDLNYDNGQLVDYIIAMMKYWVSEFDIDGFRCDVAGLVPINFWVKARSDLNGIKRITWPGNASSVIMFRP